MSIDGADSGADDARDGGNDDSISNLRSSSVTLTAVFAIFLWLTLGFLDCVHVLGERWSGNEYRAGSRPLSYKIFPEFVGAAGALAWTPIFEFWIRLHAKPRNDHNFYVDIYFKS